MSSYKGPTGEDSEKAKEKPEAERKMPDFIYVDDHHQTDTDKIGSTQQDPNQMFGSIQTMAKGSQPFYIRLLAIAAFSFVFCGSFVVLLGFLIYLTLSLLLLRQSDFLNKQTSVSWRAYKKMIVFALGSFVSIFNLSFGLGIVMMYFMLNGEKMNSRMMDELTRASSPRP